MTGIPLAIIQAAGLPAPDPIDLEAVIAQEEKNWSDLGSLQGTYFDDPSCLIPIEDEQ